MTHDCADRTPREAARGWAPEHDQPTARLKEIRTLKEKPGGGRARRIASISKFCNAVF